MKNHNDFNKICLKLRQNTFMSFVKKGEAHLGGSFSIIETLVFLFEYYLKKNDKFILSKSHSSYPFILYLRKKGYKPKITTHLEKDVKNLIYCTTGSLGHGLPIATGMAKALKLKKKKSKIIVMLSDGECQEGTTWESLLISYAHSLDNLLILIDYNKIQALQKIDEVLPLDNLRKKILAFNCNCIEIKDGHSLSSLEKGFSKININNKRPSVLIIHTTKGKGIKEFENDPAWHAKKIEGQLIKIGKKSLGIS